MIEEISDILVAKPSQQWAEEIRIIKSRELEEMIESKRKHIRELEDSYYDIQSSEDSIEHEKAYRQSVVELLLLKIRRNYLKRK